MSNEENIEPSQVKSVNMEENQERICFLSETALIIKTPMKMLKIKHL